MHEASIKLKEGICPLPKQLEELYESVGWAAYTADLEQLHRGVQKSLYVLTAWDGQQLVGLLRAVGDEETILYIQDILILPSYQRRGIGEDMIKHTIARWAHVRQKVLITDNEPKTNAFYTACGLKSLENIGAKGYIVIS